MRTKMFAGKNNAKVNRTKKHIERLKFSEIFTTENMKIIESFPRYADLLISALITLKKANLLTEENRAIIISSPKYSWHLAQAISGLHQLQLYTLNTSHMLEKFPQMALSFWCSMNVMKKIDLSSFLYQPQEKNDCNIMYK